MVSKGESPIPHVLIWQECGLCRLRAFFQNSARSSTSTSSSE
jgi:hypothetical protein